MSKFTEQQIKDRVGDFINKCPNCRHKQYSYTRVCEECGFSWEIFLKQEYPNSTLQTSCSTENKS